MTRFLPSVKATRAGLALCLSAGLWLAVRPLQAQQLNGLPGYWKWQSLSHLPPPEPIELQANRIEPLEAETHQPDSLNRWWEVFGDDQLNQLTARALSANPTLRASLARVREARAQVKAAASYLFPAVSLNASLTRESLAPNRPVPFAVEVDRSWLNTFSVPLQYSYEADGWGRHRQAVHAARHQLRAGEADARATQLLVGGEVARNYFLLRTLDREIQILERTLAARATNAALAGARFAAGLVTEIEVMRAQTEKATVAAQLVGLARSRTEREALLAVLCGQVPTEFSLPPDTTLLPVPLIPVDMPAILLGRRPDLAQQRHLLAGSKSQVRMARSAQWPRLNLLGSYELLSSRLGTLPETGSRTWLVGGGITLPLFEGGRNRASVAAAQARYAQQLARYQQTELNAFREIEAALAGIGFSREQLAAQAEAFGLARRAAVLARERYQRGMVTYYEVIDAERLALEQERLTAQLRGRQLLDVVELLVAMGGAW